MIETQTYHRDAFGLPPVIITDPVWNVTYSRHAKEMAEAREIILPRKVDLRNFDIIEVMTFQGKTVKITIRSKHGMYDLDNDLCMVISVYYGEKTVKTVWTNHRLDTHKSLDKSKFARP